MSNYVGRMQGTFDTLGDLLGAPNIRSGTRTSLTPMQANNYANQSSNTGRSSVLPSGSSSSNRGYVDRDPTPTSRGSQPVVTETPDVIPPASGPIYGWSDFWGDFTNATTPQQTDPQQLTDFSSWAEQYGLPPDLIRILDPLMEQLKANGSEVFQPTYSLFTPTVNTYNPNTGIMQAIWNAVSGMI